MDRLAVDHPGLALHGVVGDFRRHLPELLESSAGDPRMIIFLGGTIGNLNRTERHDFFTTMRNGMTPDDTLLIGTDLVKAPERLVAAYDDASGVICATPPSTTSPITRCGTSYTAGSRCACGLGRRWPFTSTSWI